MRSSSSRRAELARLIARPFAHRGLHGPGVPENSRAAFAAAIEAGYGIELDVQASADGEAMVFHDATLERLAEAEGAVSALPAEALAAIRLKKSDETIPRLADALTLIAGRAPLLIEVKAPGRRAGALSRAVERALRAYVGPVAVMSFNPLVPRWFSAHAPERLRGLVVTEAGRPRHGRLRRRLAAWLARPDFLAYDVRDLPAPLADRARARGMPVLSWTCRLPEDLARIAAYADQAIFEAPARP